MISEEDLKKLAQSEIELFNDVEKGYPSLKEYRKEIYNQFEKHFKLLLDLVINAHGGMFYNHNLVINGALMRSLNYYRGALWGLGTRNPHILYDSLRGQCETLALIYFIILNPEYVRTALLGSRDHSDKTLRIPNILEMIDKLDKKRAGIRRDYDQLCEILHPNPKSLYANITPGEEKDGVLHATFSTRSDRINKEDAEVVIRMLTIWTDWIFEELVNLFSLFKE